MKETRDEDKKIPCTVNVSRTVQIIDFEPLVIELQETRWVTEKDYEFTHEEIFDRLLKRVKSLFEEQGMSWDGK